MSLNTPLKHIINVLILLGVIYLALSIGSSGEQLNPFRELLHIDPASNHPFIFDLRLRRVLVSFLSGSLLAMAGAYSQSLFQNPLATPTILGTASAATVGAIFFNIFWPNLSGQIFCGSVFGSILATIGLVGLANRFAQDTPNLGNILLIGVGINTFMGALSTTLISYQLSSSRQVPDIMYWILGDTSGKGWMTVYAGLGALIVVVILGCFLTPAINQFNLGIKRAQSMGTATGRSLYLTIILISIAVGSSVSLTGFIPFVGLIVPLLTRSILGHHMGHLFIFSGLLGGSLTIFADLIIRGIPFAHQLNIGAITSLIGAPVFMWIVMHTQKGLVR